MAHKSAVIDLRAQIIPLLSKAKKRLTISSSYQDDRVRRSHCTLCSLIVLLSASSVLAVAHTQSTIQSRIAHH
jgi:hypothetical protein